MDLSDFDVPLGLEIKSSKKEVLKVKKPVDKKVKTFRKVHNVKLYARDIPHISTNNDIVPVSAFENLSGTPFSFEEKLVENISSMNYHTPTPIQAQTIPIMHKRYNLVACGPTGSGKTAAYLIPLLDQLFKTNVEHTPCPSHKIHLFAIVLAPTQELIRQIWSEAVRLSNGLSEEHFISRLGRAHYATRGKKTITKPKLPEKTETINLPKDSVKMRSSREMRLPRATRILIATPSRMACLLSLPDSQCPFDLSNLSWLIIDECDKLLEVNIFRKHSRTVRLSSFREQLEPIMNAVRCRNRTETEPRPASVALFSATVPEEVVEWAEGELSSDPKQRDTNQSKCTQAPPLIQLRIGKRDSTVPTVEQELRYCATEEGKLFEIRSMLLRGLLFPCLIFMDSRERANEVVKEILLSDTDLLANVISSDKTVAQRSAIVNAFRTGKINVLVCTDLLGRGIDFKGVSMVVNYDMPTSKEDYIHRVGRTGRAGSRGKAVTLWTDADLPHLGSILKVMRRSGSKVDPELERLVASWQQRRCELLLQQQQNRGQPTGSGKPVNQSLIGRRKKERRLVRSLLASADVLPKKARHVERDVQEASGDRAKGSDASDRIKWMRPWNPHRKRISQLSAAKIKEVGTAKRKRRKR